MIHANLTTGGISAWHYWWINPSGPGTKADPDNGALTSSGQLTRRAFVLGNWARFVRPGFVRVTATEHPFADVSVTAFQGPAGQVAIVALNEGWTSVGQDFQLLGAAVGVDATPWVTSADLALIAGSAVPITEGTFSALLAPRSVTTFVIPPPG